MQKCITSLIFFALVVLVPKSDTFFLNQNTGPCPNSIQCSCAKWPGEINCGSRGLHSIPTFQLTDKYNRIRLENNDITYIGASAFKSFGCENNVPIYLHLSSNKISFISDGAFSGLEGCKLVIDLSNNLLDHIPPALRHLRNLESLNILGNPLLSLSNDITASIGSSLKELRVDIGKFGTWPVEIGLLMNLEKLDLNGIPFDTIGSWVFGTFNNLKEIIISQSKLKVIPSALCSLTRLTTVNISSNYHFNLSRFDMFDVCGNMNRSGAQIKQVYFYENNVSVFPNFMTMFPNVEKIGLRSNGQLLINEDELSNATDLKSISLSRNSLTRIPYALNKFTSLTYVSLKDNEITSIEEPDIAKLTSLVTLDLEMNPLQYITKDAFLQNKALTTLYLSNTHLRKIPLSVTLIPNLSFLTLNNGQIQCKCDMPYVKQWDFRNVYFRNATCHTSNELIEHFLSDYARTC